MANRRQAILKSIQFQIKQILNKIEQDTDITAVVYHAVYRPQLDALFIKRDKYI